MESHLDRHLCLDMRANPRRMNAFIGASGVVRRPYTMEEIECVARVRAMPDCIVPPSIKQLYCAEHFEVPERVDVAVVDDDNDTSDDESDSN